MTELEEELWEKSRTRWRAAKPDDWLTWIRVVKGDNFIRKISSYNVFNSESSVLEIGPGYGRLLKSVLEQGVPFKSYLGVDISIQNINYLKEAFEGENISFSHGDIENIILGESFDIMFSSLTFKHLFPSFEKALQNVSRNLAEGGWVFFDLIEGDERYFEADEVTYIRHYTRQEIEEILQNSSLILVAFDEVVHDEEHIRLLVVGRKL